MVQLLKVHGSQNKFFILDQTELKTKLSQPEFGRIGQTHYCRLETDFLTVPMVCW